MLNNTTTTKVKTRTIKDWACQECGKLLTLKQAEKATYGCDGCPKCGGSDIFLASTEQLAKQVR
jgi:ssDNA-binding Zn-finger/Zn-ribbon topoisomerase 1